MLTKGVDNVSGTAANDLVIGISSSDPDLNTLNALDVINGGTGTDTLRISSDQAAIGTLPSLSSVEVIEVQSTVGVTINTTAVSDLTKLNITKANGAIDADAGAAADVSVALKAAGAAVDVDGGKNVTVTLTDVAGAADVVSVGTATAAKGDVVVSATGAAYVAAGSPTLSAINVTGGKTVTVTQKATSSDAAAAADKAAGTITQGDITIVADATTTTVGVKQDAAVTAVNAAETTGGVTETASVKFSALTAGQTIILGGLTLTADVAMTANEVAAAFANLVNGAAYGALVPAGDTQSGALATKGTYTGVFANWTSGAASGDTVVFTSTTANSNVADLANTGTGTATVTTTAGKAHDATPAGGKAGIVAGAVAITGGAALKTVTVDGFGAGSAITGGSNTALDTISLANGAGVNIASAASTLALTLKNVNGTVDVQAGTTTLNADVSGTGTAALKSATATAVNVSGSGSVSGTAGAGTWRRRPASAPPRSPVRRPSPSTAPRLPTPAAPARTS